MFFPGKYRSYKNKHYRVRVNFAGIIMCNFSTTFLRFGIKIENNKNQDHRRNEILGVPTGRGFRIFELTRHIDDFNFFSKYINTY